MTLTLHEVEVSFGRTVVLHGSPSNRSRARSRWSSAGMRRARARCSGRWPRASGRAASSLDGSPIASLAPADRARRLAYLPQHPDVVGPFTVADVVSL